MIRFNRVVLRAVSVGLTGAMLAATPAWAATNSLRQAGIASVLESEAEETMAVGGVAQVTALSAVNANARKVLADSSVKYQMTDEEVAAQVELASQIAEEAEEANPYANIAISQVNNYVNIRTEASQESEIVGKIYNNAAATILDTVETEDGTWYQIESGSVEGYIKSNYFVTGAEAEAIAYEVGDVKVTVSTETLRLRSQASLESSTVTLLSEDERYDMISQTDDFVQIQIDDDVSGYVSKDYVDISVEFEKAISLEEEREALEAKRIAEEAAAAEAAAEAAVLAAAEAEDEEDDVEEEEQTTTETAETTEAAEPETTREAEGAAETTEAAAEPETTTEAAEREPETTTTEAETTTTEAETTTTEAETTTTEAETTTTEAETTTTTKEETTASSSSSSTSSVRQQIVNYALSFVGNLKYVYGGNSLSTGVDCSGFVQQIYKHFGYSLPRTSDSQGSSGKSVSSSEMQPGDLVYYGGHIAIYIGGGQVVHASNAKTGIKVSTWNYRTVKSIRNVLG